MILIRVLAVACAIVLALAAPGAAKEGIVAKVQVPIPRAAEPGSRVTMVWTLTFVESGKARPFGAEEVFMRLFGPDGSRSRRAYATRLDEGHYRATARVPRGGVDRVVVGQMDWNDRGLAPVRFPVIGRVFR